MTGWTDLAPLLRSVLRIVAALLFLEHGLMKLVGFPAAGGLPDPLPPMLLVAGWLEVVGGALLVAGLFTRPVAFLLSGEMAAAYFIGHIPQGFWPALNGGEAAILFCFLFLYLSAAGPGPWSLDEALRARRPELNDRSNRS